MTFIFTFGADHRHPRTGVSLGRCYIEVPGDIEQSRRIMHALFGRDWAFQYADKERAGVFKHDLRLLANPRLEALSQSPSCGCFALSVKWNGSAYGETWTVIGDGCDADREGDRII